MHVVFTAYQLRSGGCGVVDSTTIIEKCHIIIEFHIIN